MSKLPDSLRTTMYDKNNNAYVYSGTINLGSPESGDYTAYLYTKDPSLVDREYLAITNSGFIVHPENEGFLYTEKQELFKEGYHYVDNMGRVYTLVKDGRKDPTFTNPWVKLIFLDSNGKTQARDANGNSLTAHYSITRRL